LKVSPFLKQSEVKLRAVRKEINLRYYPDGCVGVSLDETVTQGQLHISYENVLEIGQLRLVSLSSLKIFLKK
jgi:hypothetical protein